MPISLSLIGRRIPLGFVLFCHAASAGDGPGLRIEPNRGQAAPGVLFAARGPNLISLYRAHDVVLQQNEAKVHLRFPGASALEWQPEGAAIGKVHYLRPGKSLPDVPQHGRIRARRIYPGVDIVFHGDRRQLEFDLEVAPGADPRKIQIEASAAPVTLESHGGISLGGFLRWMPPVAFQPSPEGRATPVDCRFQVNGGTISFALGPYDRTRPLVIDPVVTAARLVGGSADDEVIGLTSQFAVGNTTSFDWPIRAGTPRDTDVFLTSGNDLDRVTYIIGGTGVDRVLAMHADSGVIAIVGETNSRDFPMGGSTFFQSPRPTQSVYGGGASDGFVLVFGERGFQLVTYLGGTGTDRLQAVAVDTQSGGFDIVVAGTTSSITLPVKNAFVPAFSGGATDGFFATYTLGGALLDLSYYGGRGDDSILALHRDAGHLWIGGTTSQASWLGPAGAPADSGFLAGAVRTVNDRWQIANARALPGTTSVTAIRSWQGDPVVGGHTRGAGLPVTNAAQADPGGAMDVFLGRWNPGLSEPRWLTYWGGNGADSLTALELGTFGLLAGGQTDSTDMTTREAVQTGNGGGQDGWAAGFRPDGTLAWSTYLGGSDEDRVNAIRPERFFNATVAGRTKSADWLARALPASSPLLFDQRELRGGTDGFQVSIQMDAPDAGWIGSRGIAFPIPAFEGPSNENVQFEFDTPGVAEWLRNGVSLGARGLFPANVSGLGIRCLVDSGETLFRFRTLDRETRGQLLCRPPELDFEIPSMLSSFVGGVNVRILFGPRDPRTGQIFPLSRFPDGLRFTSGSPDIVTITNINSFQPISIFPSFTVRSTGEATFTLSADGFAPVSRKVMFRIPRYTLDGPSALGKDLEVVYRLQFEQPTPPGIAHQIGVRSSDDRRLQVNTGTPVSFGASQQWFDFSLQALAGEGSVQIEVDSSVAGRSVFPIRLTPTTLRWDWAGPLPLAIEPGTERAVNVQLSADPPDLRPSGNNPVRLRFGLNSLEIPVASSAPGIVELGENRLVFTRELSGRSVTLRARAPGNANLSVAPGSGFASSPASFPVRVGLPPAIANDPFAQGIGLNLQVAQRVDGIPGLTLTSQDPSKLLLSLASDRVGTASVRVPEGGTVFFQALAGEGEVRVRGEAPGRTFQDLVIPLRPAAIVLPSSARVTRYALVVGFGAWMLDPVTLTPVAGQPLRGGYQPNVQILTDREDALVPGSLTVEMGGDSPFGALRIRAIPTGLGEFTWTVQQPSGFTTPSYGSRVRVRVEPLRLPEPGGVNWTLQGYQQIYEYTPFGIPAEIPLTFTSSRPDVLRVSTDAGALGGETVTVRPSQGRYRVFLQSHAAAGTADLIIGGEDIEPRPMPIVVSAIAVEFSPRNSVRLSLPGGEQTLGAIIQPVSLPDLNWYNLNGLPTLSPGVPAPACRVTSSQPDIIRVVTPAVTPRPGVSEGVQVRAAAAGASEVALSCTGTVLSPTGADRLIVSAGSVLFNPQPLTIGFGLVSTMRVSPDNPNATLPNPLRLVATSRDPSRLLLSTASGLAGQSSIQIPLAASQRDFSFAVHALASEGTAIVDLTADGVPAGQGVVTLVPSRVETVAPGISRLANSPPFGMGLTLRYDVGNQNGFSGDARPGIVGTVRAVSANPAIARVSGETLPLGPRMPDIEVAFVGPGRTTIALETTGGFAPGRPIEVEVLQPPAAVIAPEQPTIGGGLQRAITVGTPSGQPAVITLTSLDPSRLLVSTSPDTPGAESATVSYTGREASRVWLQAVAASGTVPVRISAPGLPDRLTDVRLATPAVRLARLGEAPIPTLGPAAPLQVQTGVLDGQFGQPDWEQAPRAGTTIPVEISNTDPAVGAVMPSRLELSSGRVGQVAVFQPIRPGTAVLALSLPAGFEPRISLRQLLLNVVQSRLELVDNGTPVPSVSVGRGTVRSLFLQHSPGPLGEPLRVAISSSDPSRVLLAISENLGRPTARAPEVETTFRSGGFAPSLLIYGVGDPGLVTLRVTAAGAPELTLAVRVLTAGFTVTTFPERRDLSVGESVTFIAQLSLYDPETRRVFAAEPGGTQFRLPATSTDQLVLPVPSELLFFNDRSSFSVRALRPGTATIRIAQPPGFQDLPGAEPSFTFQVR